MENTLAVAKELYCEYYDMFKKNMDEMKMHKLMYFLQRESLIKYNEILFREDFIGWKFGPVLLSIRHEYKQKYLLFSSVTDSVSDTTKDLIKSILDRYASLSSWKLSELSHDELSWKSSRKNLKIGENGNQKIDVNKIRIDAIREKFYREIGDVL